MSVCVRVCLFAPSGGVFQPTCDTFLESGRSQKLNGTMEFPPKNLKSWNPGILESWNETN